MISKLTIETGHSYDSWVKNFTDVHYPENAFWSFTLQDVVDGAIELDETKVYWLVKDNNVWRLGETDEEV